MMAPEHDRETWEEYTEMKQNGEKYKGDPLAIGKSMRNPSRADSPIDESKVRAEGRR